MYYNELNNGSMLLGVGLNNNYTGIQRENSTNVKYLTQCMKIELEFHSCHQESLWNRPIYRWVESI